jgi:hypothetical protein
MKKSPSKRDIRQQIEQHMLDYIEQGGEVVEVEKGASAYTPSSGAPTTALFQDPKTSRTPLGGVVNELEARRHPGKTPQQKSKPQAPQKTPIYDDFGEIIRWVWREEGDANGK